MSNSELKELSEKYKNGHAEDLPVELSDEEFSEVINNMSNPLVEERILKLMEPDDGNKRRRACGIVR
ncbi:MAG: hypothetical protein V1770_02100 [bacterium]